MARITDVPALAMPEPEAKQFLAAWQGYLRHMSLATTQKTADLMTALSVTLFCYTPRMVAYAQRNRPVTVRPVPMRPQATVYPFAAPAPPPSAPPASGPGPGPSGPLAEGPPDDLPGFVN